jgi:hypothetical protein
MHPAKDGKGRVVLADEGDGLERGEARVDLDVLKAPAKLPSGSGGGDSVI